MEAGTYFETEFLRTPLEQLVSHAPNERETTVCFSMEHARFCHALLDPFDVDFIFQIFFSLEKRTIQTFVEVLYIFSLWSKFKAFLPSHVRGVQLFEHSKQQFKTILTSIKYDRKRIQANGRHQN